MARPFPVVVVGGSAGSIDAACALLANLPDDFEAALFVAIHISPYRMSALARVLSRCTSRISGHVEGDELVEPGRLYVAPPDFHLVFHDGRVRLDHGPRVNRHRPAIDVMFRSAAEVFGSRTVGILLSGNLEDGVAGLATIHRAGGLVAVQEPEEAEFPGMPSNAIRQVRVDVVAPAGDLPAQIIAALEARMETAKDGEFEPRPATRRDAEVTAPQLRCPDCNGPLAQEEVEGVATFACRVGHAYSFDRLFEAQADAVESALWSAVSVLEEKAQLSATMAERARQQGRKVGASRFTSQAHQAHEQAAVIRSLLESTDPPVLEGAAEE